MKCFAFLRQDKVAKAALVCADNLGNQDHTDCQDWACKEDLVLVLDERAPVGAVQDVVNFHHRHFLDLDIEAADRPNPVMISKLEPK